MSTNAATGHGQTPISFNNNPQGVPQYPQPPDQNALKRKLAPQQDFAGQQLYHADKQVKLEHRAGTGAPIAAAAMFNLNQGQQGQNPQQPQQIMFQGQAQVPQQNAPQQPNMQGQPMQQQIQQQQQRRPPQHWTTEDRNKYIEQVRKVLEQYGKDSPQGQAAQQSLKLMMQQMQQSGQKAQQGQVAVPDARAVQVPPAHTNGDPQALHRWRVNLTARYTQGQQKMKQIRDQLQIHSHQVAQQGGQPDPQTRASMNDLARQFKTIDAWCVSARASGQLLQNPNLGQNRAQTQLPTGAGPGADGGQQQKAAGVQQQPQQPAMAGIEQQAQQQNTVSQQPVQAQQGQLQQLPQQPAHQMLPQVSQQGQPPQQHLTTQPRQMAPQQQPTQIQNPSSQQQNVVVANRQQQPLVRPSMSPTMQTPMPQQMQQSPQMAPQPIAPQQGQQPAQQQMPRQAPVPAQQVPGGGQAVRQSPAPGTPATPTQSHPPQQVRDASVPPRPGSAQPGGQAIAGVPQHAPQQQQGQPQQQQQQGQQPQRMAGASAQSPPPQLVRDVNAINNRMHIPKTLNIQPQVPVPIQTRPTLSGGANTAGNHVMGTPALVKNPAFEFDEGGMGLLSKRKLEELVKQIDPDEKLDPEVEESVLELVDEFIDTVVTYACKMAKLRGSDTLDIKDMQVILERNWNIRVPGYAADEIRTVRKFVPAQGYVQKMNALAAGKALNQTNLKGGD